MTLVQTAGVHGYSSPCPNHVVFNVTDHVWITCGMRSSPVFINLVADHLILGTGKYKGKEEQAFALPEPVFNEAVRRWPILLAGQESVLVLGSPQARNWRPAKLKFVDGSGITMDIGVWRSVTQEYAEAAGDWSFFNGHYFVCEVNPPANMYEAQEREKQKKLDALEKIVAVLREYYAGLPEDPERIAECLAHNLQRNYDEGFVSGAEHMEIVRHSRHSKS